MCRPPALPPALYPPAAEFILACLDPLPAGRPPAAMLAALPFLASPPTKVAAAVAAVAERAAAGPNQLDPSHQLSTASSAAGPRGSGSSGGSGDRDGSGSVDNSRSGSGDSCGRGGGSGAGERGDGPADITGSFKLPALVSAGEDAVPHDASVVAAVRRDTATEEPADGIPTPLAARGTAGDPAASAAATDVEKRRWSLVSVTRRAWLQMEGGCVPALSSNPTPLPSSIYFW
jgi:hypothetical protein